jgi:hypothetical protein
MAVAARLNTTYWGLLKQPDNQKLASLQESPRTVPGIELFEQLFEEMVVPCLDAGLVQGDNLSVDQSFVEDEPNEEVAFHSSSWRKQPK